MIKCIRFEHLSIAQCHPKAEGRLQYCVNPNIITIKTFLFNIYSKTFQPDAFLGKILSLNVKYVTFKSSEFIQIVYLYIMIKKEQLTYAINLSQYVLWTTFR